MTTQSNLTLRPGILIGTFIFLTAFRPVSADAIDNTPGLLYSGDLLRIEVVEILDAKCNVCHRKKNPFMIFNTKNMEKRAKKIYNAVFINKRMPKGNEIQLSAEEYQTLEKWLLTQNIN